MILIDTGPFVALFDRQDAKHEECKDTLKAIQEPLCTTIPVLTEAFHLLTPDSIRSLSFAGFYPRRRPYGVVHEP
jgi:uncharacterized protein